MAEYQTHRERAWTELLEWLQSSGLTATGCTYDILPSQELGTQPGAQPPEALLVGRPSHRVEAKTLAELKLIKDATALSSPVTKDDARWNAIWQELRSPEDAVRRLDIARIPADAFAFYRPFHFEPFDQWGIYLILPRFLHYCKQLQDCFRSVKSLEPAVLMSLVLFEMFHHEFFHHLVECTATSIEILCPAATKRPTPVYLMYRRRDWEQVLGSHCHDPLEEALANAYAYNSLSFMARVQGGYLSGASRLYQKALERSWKLEPPGYREAGSYIKGERLYGARVLLQRMLAGIGPPEDRPLGMLVETVFPRGHTAFWAKPDVPTYLVGSPSELAAFHHLVPAPNETYSALFWPGDTAPLDAYIKTRRQEERKARQGVLKLEPEPKP